MFNALLNACHRRAYRLAYPILEIWWNHHRHDGVLMAIWVDDRVLMVQHSYKPGWSVPGGGVKSGEDHHLCALRELYEEVGLRLEPIALTLVWVKKSLRNNGGSVHLFEAVLPTEPTLHIDQREIINAKFVRPSEVIKNSDRYMVQYLQARTVQLV